jgi:PAS domain S-box-containing protein
MYSLLSIPIRKQLLLIVLIVALPAAAIIIMAGYNQRMEAIQDAEEDTQELAAIISAEQSYRVEAAEQLMETIGQLPDVKLHRTTRVETLLANLLNLNTRYSNIFIADLSGNVWASALPSNTIINISDRRHFKNALRTGKLSSGEYTVSRFSEKQVLTLAYPYKDGSGNISGVICLGFNLNDYRQLLNSSQQNERKSYLLLDHNGVILAQTGDHGELVGKLYSEEQFKRRREGPDQETIEEKDRDGRGYFVSYRKLRLAGEEEPYLYVRAAIPMDTVLSDASRQLCMNMGAFAVLLLAALFLSWFIGKRSIADRVSILESVSRSMADGDLQVRAATLVGVGELGSLARSLDHMADQLQAREQEKTKLLEATLRASERRLELHVKQTPLGVIEWNRLFKIETWNPAAESIFGYREQEAVGSDISFLAPDRLKETAIQRWRNLIEMKSGSRRVDENITKKGEIIICEWYDTPLVDGSGTVIGVTSLINDISLQKHLEAEYQAVLQATRDGFWINDRNGRFLEINTAYCTLIGYTREELLTMSIPDIEAAEDEEDIKRHIEKIRRTGSDTFETRHRRKDGTLVDIEVSVIYLNIGGGKFYVFLRDITERKQVDRILRASENKYRALHQSLMDGFSSINMDGTFLDCNESYLAMLGYSREELRRLTYKDITPETWHGMERKIIDNQVLLRGYSDVYEKEYRRKDGTIFPVELRAFLIKDDSGNNVGMWAIARDITERKLAQEEKERLYREQIEIKQRHLTEKEGLLMDLHDGVGGQVSNIRLLSELSQRTNDIESIKKTLVTISQLAKDAITEIRGLMQGLESDEADWQTLVSTLRSEGVAMVEPHGIRYTDEVVVDASGKPSSLLMVNLSRIYKEALTNVIKHANATAVVVSLSVTNDKLALRIHDNGNGLNDITPSGRGLIIMQKRAKDLGGVVSINSSDDGTIVVLEVPLAGEQAQI